MNPQEVKQANSFEHKIPERPGKSALSSISYFLRAHRYAIYCFTRAHLLLLDVKNNRPVIFVFS